MGLNLRELMSIGKIMEEIKSTGLADNLAESLAQSQALLAGLTSWLKIYDAIRAIPQGDGFLDLPADEVTRMTAQLAELCGAEQDALDRLAELARPIVDKQRPRAGA